jgi:hypothetical protein
LVVPVALLALEASVVLAVSMLLVLQVEVARVQLVEALEEAQ